MQQLEHGQYDLRSTTDAHVLGALLKAWFRELTPPLLPFSIYSQCIAAGKILLAGSAVGAQGEVVRLLVQGLPGLNRRVLHHWHCFCGKLTAPGNLASNRMTVANLAIIFAPSFLRKELQSPEEMMGDVKPAAAFIELLLKAPLASFMQEEARAEVDRRVALLELGVGQAMRAAEEKAMAIEEKTNDQLQPVPPRPGSPGSDGEAGFVTVPRTS